MAPDRPVPVFRNYAASLPAVSRLHDRGAVPLDRAAGGMTVRPAGDQMSDLVQLRQICDSLGNMQISAQAMPLRHRMR